MKVFVSSYAAASPAMPWDRRAEEALFGGLAEMGLAGLELPFTGALHAHDEAWLVDRLRPDWRFIVTLLPGAMRRLKDDPHFGLASSDAAGRRRALDFAEQASLAVRKLNSALDRKAVAAVEIHSAPRLGGGARSSKEDFAASLSTLRALDWHGADLLVEHCDAFVSAHAPDKGFLRLEDELSAIGASRGPTTARIMINWGRSAIESRSAGGPQEHLQRARESRLLGGLFFSGATPAHPDYGAWKDSHAPFSTSCPASILTPDAAAAALETAGELPFLGLKIQPLPASLDVPERLALLRAGLQALKTP